MRREQWGQVVHIAAPPPHTASSTFYSLFLEAWFCALLPKTRAIFDVTT